MTSLPVFRAGQPTSWMHCRPLLLPLVLILGCLATDPVRLVAEDQFHKELTPEELAKWSAGWRATIDEQTKKLAANGDSVEARSRRGDAYFFLGKFADAVADYDAMVDRDSALAASHWRRGIALFYAEKYPAAAQQFTDYHSHDQIDRENGIWRYLSQYKADGRDVARRGLLKYAKDDREPFPAVYQLFAGKLEPASILAKIEAAELPAPAKAARQFYAELYIGLNYVVEEEPRAAQQHLHRAVSNRWALGAGYGPAYMWHVGRLQEALLAEQLAKEEVRK